ncbi:MAG: hypothetical protein IJK91_03480 [Bacteroidales bacterium]|nr:hypothetical protein [Bacteroidales bacterium]
MLVAKYGAQTFATIRKAMALLIIQPSNNDDIASTNETAKNSVVAGGAKTKGKKSAKGSVKKSERKLPVPAMAVEGVIIHPNSLKDDEIADKLLVIIGNPTTVKKMLKLKYGLLVKRRPKVIEYVESLYEQHSEEYIQKHDKWINRHSSTSSEAFKAKVKAQNERFEQSRRKECYGFKLIYTPMGNKR